MMVSEIRFLATMPKNVRGRWFSTLKKRVLTVAENKNYTSIFCMDHKYIISSISGIVCLPSPVSIAAVEDLLVLEPAIINKIIMGSQQ